MTIVESVNFSFMSDEEAKNLSVVNITNPDLLDMLDKPIPGGLYDTAMGPLDDGSLCKTCGQRAFLCNGHWGRIELVLPSYNPLLFDKLCNLLNKTCLYCFHFRSSKEEVENSLAQFKLIEKGDIIGAKKLRLRQKLRDQEKSEFGLPDDIIDQEDSQGSHTSHAAFLSEDKNHNKQASWDSFQLTEAMSVLNEFLKKKQKKCMNCKRKNPKINKLTFGWFHVIGNSSAEIRSNAIRSGRLDATENGGCEDKALSEVVNASDYSCMGDSETVEAHSFNAASDSSKKRSKEGVNEKINLNQWSQDTSSYLSGHLLPSEVRDILRRLWKNEASICSYMSDIQQRFTGTGYSMFFLETILVLPIKFRLPAKGGDSVMEHPHTNLLGKILLSNIALRNAYNYDSERPRIIRPWMDLQQSINDFFDRKTATGYYYLFRGVFIPHQLHNILLQVPQDISRHSVIPSLPHGELDTLFGSSTDILDAVIMGLRIIGQSQKDGFPGICQILEKKEGIFRQNMMGKRVNFAGRSVISPDPYLAVDEIGIPLSVALKLTYPERVTPYNAAKLRDAVINGPGVHPGATTYVDSVATVKLPPSQKMRIAISRKLPSSRGIDAQSGKINEQSEGKIVYRHLRDDDHLLVNRQPTLHKPGVMAMRVRVMKGEKTIRMHYANCSSFNADFDGDEINVHFPQDENARAEARFIVNANEQYIVPTRGDTVRGLIQDHIVSAVILTMKNTFLTRSEFSHLLYASGVFAVVPGLLPANYSRKVSVVNSEGVVESILPTVWKPVPLWTGKQVITALLNQITRGCDPCTVKNQGKIPKNYFTGNPCRNGEEDADHNAEHEFLIWKNELVRGVIDKSQFGKFGLVHTVQELYGSNSAGILLSALSRLFTIFLQFHGFTCGLDDLIILPNHDVQRKEKLDGEDVGEEVHCEFVNFKPGQIGPEELQLEIEKVICSDRESATASLDMKMKNKLTNRLTREGSQILKHLLTAGLLKPFPKNCISVMTTTGAKGSTVNFQQISAYLGQQELEGRRVPRMVSGKTLPSFPPWDFTSRAGGFITDRFLTGLRPQEYYFHCMAGREGLVDTAVKTSRSGYLQRCLVKNLESLKVCHDYTVRDADGSIIQFYYGEDGVDVHHTSFLKNFKALEDNQDPFCQKFENKREFNSYICELPEGLEDEAKCFIQEALDKSLEKQNSSAMKHLHKKGKAKKKEVLSKKDKAFAKEQDRFLELVKQKYLSSLAQPGEPVGVIAAQSVGEPSTQMTLNTFHLAGRGEMNVTLGIPRLQEILMTASDVIKTPMLTCPFSEWRSKCDAVSLVSSVKKVTVADLVENMEVQLAIEHHQVARIYKLTMKLKDTEFVSLEDTQDTLKTVFLRELEDALENHVIFLSRINGIKHIMSSSRSEASTKADDDASGARSKEVDDDDYHDMGDDLGSDAHKRKLQGTDEMDYDDGSDVDHHSEDEFSADQEKSKSNLDCHEDSEETEHSEDRYKSSNAHNVDDVTSIAKSKSKSSGKKDRATSKILEKCSNLSGKKIRRAVHMEVKGLSFVVHFRFTSEPHVLLAQIAQKTAKKVCIKKSRNISQCKMVQYDPDEKTVIWDDKKKPKRGQQTNETAYWAVKASGVDFKPIWEMHDDLDLTRLYSNDINAVLKTYGVEAARATLIREVKQVFDIYGVKIDYRHLSLIADYMTHTGGYRPMSRHGGIRESASPILKMSFETAFKFIVEAASLGLTDNLDTPSSLICLGLPVKMGTGCFGIVEKLDC